MSNKSLEKGKHLRMEDRLIIEYGLNENYSLKEIAERIKKDPRLFLKKLNVINLIAIFMFVTIVIKSQRVLRRLTEYKELRYFIVIQGLLIRIPTLKISINI